MTVFLIKLGVRVLIFALVFWFATRRNPKVVIKPRMAMPLVALVFAVLNAALYWLSKVVLNLATFGSVIYIMPFVVNLLLLLATIKLFGRKQWLKVDGVVAMCWLAAILTAAHGVLWFATEFAPRQLG